MRADVAVSIADESDVMFPTIGCVYAVNWVVLIQVDANWTFKFVKSA